MMKNLTQLKLLLLSFLIVLNANLIGCSNKKDESNINEILSTESSIVDNNIKDTILSSEIIATEIVVDPKQEVMDLIDYGSIKKVYYVLEDTTLNIPSYLSENNIEESVILPKLECLEVYDQVDDICLVKTNEYIGYVTTDNLEELTGTFVVVDISSQELKLYCDNEVILTSPVVTGSPSTPSDQGLFEIYDISGPRNLVTPEYKTFVDIMMKYHGNEGLHDAEHHTHEDGFKHGWRDLDEFGGDTYLTDGSHGCINMPRDEVMTVKEYAEIGTKVLVKE